MNINLSEESIQIVNKVYGKMLNHYSSEKCKPKPQTCQEGYHPKKPEVYNKVQLVLVRIWGNWDPYILLDYHII